MKVGDLVQIKYPSEYWAERLNGVILGFSGECPRVLWNDGQVSLETKSLLEVISASR